MVDIISRLSEELEKKGKRENDGKPCKHFVGSDSVFSCKWFFVVGLVMYVAFGVVIVRQVGVMTEAVEDEFNGVIFILVWAHLLLAVGLLILAIVVL